MNKVLKILFVMISIYSNLYSQNGKVYLPNKDYYSIQKDTFFNLQVSSYYKYFNSFNKNIIITDTMYHDKYGQCTGTPYKISIYNDSSKIYIATYDCVYYPDKQSIGLKKNETYILSDLFFGVDYYMDSIISRIVLVVDKKKVNEIINYNGINLKGITFSYDDFITIKFDSLRNVDYMLNSKTGMYLSYYSNHFVKEKGILNNYKRIGIWSEYHDNGELKSQGVYNPEFKWTKEGYTEAEVDSMFNSNPNLKIITEITPVPIYQKESKWQYFNREGKLAKEEYYEKGKLLKTKEY